MVIVEYIPRIVQTIIALPMLILTMTYWNQNQIGENTINFATVVMYVIGFDHIIIPYRWIIDKKAYEYELAILTSIFFFLGKLFEKFQPSDNDLIFNRVCEWHYIIVIGANVLFFVVILMTLLAFSCRQIYRLQTETLLSTSQNLEPE